MTSTKLDKPKLKTVMSYSSIKTHSFSIKSSRPIHLPVSKSNLNYYSSISISQPISFNFGLSIGISYSLYRVASCDRFYIGYCKVFICCIHNALLGLGTKNIYYCFLLYIVYWMLFIYSLLLVSVDAIYYIYVHLFYIVYQLLFIQSLNTVIVIGLFIYGVDYSYLGLDYLYNFNLS